jgi:hypothetical protein
MGETVVFDRIVLLPYPGVYILLGMALLGLIVVAVRQQMIDRALRESRKNEEIRYRLALDQFLSEREVNPDNDDEAGAEAPEEEEP